MSEHPHHIPTEAVLERSFEELKEHPLINTYKPQFLGSGQEQVVLDFPEHAKVVAKLPVYVMREVVQGRCDLDQEIEQDRKINSALKRHFGSHALREYVGKKQIPLTDELQAVMLRGIKHEPIESIETMVRIQERVPAHVLESEYQDGAMWMSVKRAATKSKEALSSRARYLFAGEGVLEDEDIHKILGPREQKLAKMIEEDQGFKEAVADFVKRAIAYTNDTGYILDAAGPNNMIYYQEDGEWDYVLIDAKHAGFVTVENMQKWLDTLLSDKDLPVWQVRSLASGFSYVSVINMFAHLCGVKERLSVRSFADIDDDTLGVFIENFNNIEFQAFKKYKAAGLWEYIQKRPTDTVVEDYLWAYGLFAQSKKDPGIAAIVHEISEYLNANPSVDFETFAKSVYDIAQKHR